MPCLSLDDVTVLKAELALLPFTKFLPHIDVENTEYALSWNDTSNKALDVSHLHIFYVWMVRDSQPEARHGRASLLCC